MAAHQTSRRHPRYGQKLASMNNLGGCPGGHFQDFRRSLAVPVEATATPGRGEFPALKFTSQTTGPQVDIYTYARLLIPRGSP